MTSLIDEDTTTQYQNIGKEVITHMKTYNFFVYYQRNHLGNSYANMNLEVNKSMMQKIAFKLKSDKSGEYAKNVQLTFHDIEDQNQLSSSLHDLKVTSQESKTKIVFFTSEAKLSDFFLKSKILNINLQLIPFCLYTSGIHCDLSRFLGWGEPGIENLSGLSVSLIQKDVRKWVQSPTQKIDVWSIEMRVSSQGGSIQKLNQNNQDLDKFKSNAHQQLFMSNLSIGYHPHLLLDYEQRKSKKPSLFNKFMYSFQGMKKFCCVGNYSMRESTGLIKIDFADQKGQHEILKYFREPEMEEDSQYIQSKKQNKNRKKVLSVVMSNIDRFLGDKINGNNGSKMNDQKLELFTFQSISQSTKISSVSGEINMQFSPDHPVFLQVNDSCYRLQKPLSIKIEPFGKARVVINKETLCC